MRKQLANDVRFISSPQLSNIISRVICEVRSINYGNLRPNDNFIKMAFSTKIAILPGSGRSDKSAKVSLRVYYAPKLYVSWILPLPQDKVGSRQLEVQLDG